MDLSGLDLPDAPSRHVAPCLGSMLTPSLAVNAKALALVGPTGANEFIFVDKPNDEELTLADTEP